MPTQITSETLEALQHLLREGRVQEADNQLATLDEALKRAELEAQMAKPAGQPPTDAELELAFKTAVTAALGNPPRLTAILVEIRGRAERRDE
ncbi:MAG: hypothetical protein JO121_05615 [Deltaproteobacteria bacterium]|nr:hypothetical protein [Deltaproteobacteria bacterium]